MAVARSAIKAPVASTAISGTQTVASFITVGATDTFLLVGFEVDSATIGTPVAHWDSAGSNQLMTQIGTTLVNSTSSPAMSMFFMGVVNPTAGLKTISYSCPGVSGSPSCYLTGITFTGTQTASVAAAIYAFAGNQASAANATVSSASAILSGDMAVTVYNNIPGFTNAFTAGTNPGDGGNAIGKNESLTTNMASESYTGAGSTINSSAANASSAQFAAIIVGIAAAGAAAAGPGRTPASIFRPGQGPTRGLYTQRSTFVPTVITPVAGDGAASGTGAASGVGAGLAASVAASAGIGAAAGVGGPLFSGVGSSAGTGTATGIAPSPVNGVGSSDGIGFATAIGAALAAAVAASAGVATAAATSSTGNDGVASSTGVGAATGVGVALAASAGASSGSGVATGAAASLFAGVGAATGSGTATGIAAEIIASVAAAAGSGTALGVGDAGSSWQMVGTSAGIGTATAIGAGAAGSVATAAGSSIVLGFSPVTKVAMYAPHQIAATMARWIVAPSGTIYQISPQGGVMSDSTDVAWFRTQGFAPVSIAGTDGAGTIAQAFEDAPTILATLRKQGLALWNGALGLARRK